MDHSVLIRYQLLLFMIIDDDDCRVWKMMFEDAENGELADINGGIFDDNNFGLIDNNSCQC
jgi:hypothetical protein